jgi:ABC-type glycerol-3-phosphate transport system permease component
MFRSRTSRRRIVSAITYVLLILTSIYSLFPIIWAFCTSIKPDAEVRTAHPTFFTAHPTLENYKFILFNSSFIRYFFNSVIVSVSTVISSIFIGVFAAYALSRLTKTPGVKAFGNSMLAAQMVPVVLLIIPLYQFMMKLGLLNTYASLIITYTVFAVPVITWMLKGFFDTIPYEIEESAEMDGCNRFMIVFRIVLPLSIPAIVSAGVYALILAWSEFVLTFTFINQDSMRTLSTGVFNFMGLWTVDWGRLMAAAILIVLPIAIVFSFTQKYLISGLTAGSTKG